MTDAGQDAIDRAIAEWRRERPDLDVASIGVVARLNRVVSRMAPELEATLARFGLTRADFSVLATLRRRGPAGRLAQRTLMGDLALTSGTVSVRVDRLAAAGLVVREADPTDRRGVIVALTTAGAERFDAAAPEHLATEDRLLAPLDPAERDALAGLLRKLVQGLEAGSADDEEVTRLGVRVAPARVARRLRTAVGLPDRPGLLVRAVDPEGPGARAGLAEGDLLVSAGGAEVRGVETLNAALAASGGRLRLGVVRGVEERRVEIGPPGTRELSG